MGASSDADTVRVLLDAAGTTYAQEAGIRLRDQPAPLFQLLELTLLLSGRIRAGVAVSAARALFAAGCTTPARTSAAGHAELVAALDTGHYDRYDERTADQLADCAARVHDTWSGDLRGLRRAADGDPGRVADLVQEFSGIGPVGATIFAREAQGLWPELAPALDDRALGAARDLGLPGDAAALAGLVDPADLPRLAAALVRVSLDRDLRDRVHDGDRDPDRDLDHDEVRER